MVCISKSRCFINALPHRQATPTGYSNGLFAVNGTDAAISLREIKMLWIQNDSLLWSFSFFLISTRVFCKKFVNDIGFRNICSQAFNDKRRSFIVFHDTLKSGAYDIMLILCGVVRNFGFSFICFSYLSGTRGSSMGSLLLLERVLLVVITSSVSNSTISILGVVYSSFIRDSPYVHYLRGTNGSSMG